MLRYISVGYVLRPQGIKGEIKVEPLTDDMEQFNDWDTLYLEQGGEYTPLKVTAKRYRDNHLFLRIQGYSDINLAEKLRGKYLWIAKDELGNLPRDTFLIVDIIGCVVHTQEGQELGRVRSIIHTGSNDVYVVKGPLGEILIPGLKKVVSEVDIKNKRIAVVAQELEGLLPDEY